MVVMMMMTMVIENDMYMIEAIVPAESRTD